MAPTPGTAPSNGRIAQLRRRLWLWLRHVECKDNGHRPRTATLREKHSRFHIEVTTCMDCGQVLDAEGRRSFRV